MSRQIAMWIATIMMILASARNTDATVSASFPGGGGTASVGNPSAGHYTVTLTRTDTSSGTIDALVTGASTDIIDSIVVVTNNAAGITRVTVRGTSPQTATGTLVSMSKSGTGPVTLTELRLADDVGAANTTAIAIDTIDDFIVAGDVLGHISVVNNSFTLASSVSGNFLGNLTVSNGSITRLDVSGDIGSSSSPVSITASGNLVVLQAANVYANIDVTGAVQTFRVIGTPGNVIGSVSAGSLATISGEAGEFLVAGRIEPALSSPIAPLDIAGDIAVPTTLSIVSDLPAQVHGDITSTLTMNAPPCKLVVHGTTTGSIILRGFPQLGGRPDIWDGKLTMNSLAGQGAVLIEGSSQGEIDVMQNIDVSGRIDVRNNLEGEGRYLTIHGDLDGEVIIGRSPDFGGSIASTVIIGGDLRGRVLVRRNANPSGSNETGRLRGTLRIDGELLGEVIIDSAISEQGQLLVGEPGQLPVTGLRGQVVINRANNLFESWNGQVVVNDNLLVDRPTYTIPSDQLGGGAVGLAPFARYDEDSKPPSGSFLSRTSFELDGARIRYYGPIEFGESAIPIVEMRDPYRVGVWADVSTMFSLSIPASEKRTLWVRYIGTPGKLSPGVYRVSIPPESLLSAGVAARFDTPNDVTGGDYYFTVAFDCDNSGGLDANDFQPVGLWNPLIDCDANGVADTCDIANSPLRDANNNGILDSCETDCPCDWNDDDFINSQDFFDFLLDFFENEADFNNDSFTNSQDFFDFIICLFAGC